MDRLAGRVWIVSCLDGVSMLAAFVPSRHVPFSIDSEPSLAGQ